MKIYIYIHLLATSLGKQTKGSRSCGYGEGAKVMPPILRTILISSTLGFRSRRLWMDLWHDTWSHYVSQHIQAHLWCLCLVSISSEPSMP